MHDRTYDGLEWLGPGDKPAKEVFLGWQELEAREERIELNKSLRDAALMEERRRQQLVKIYEEAKTLEEKIDDQYKQLRSDILKQKEEAAHVYNLIAAGKAVDEVFTELTRSQHLINKEAEKYLADTDWFITRKLETGEEIPEEVSRGRAEARSRIERGTLVHSKWKDLRRSERPSREEIQRAVKLGGDELERIRHICETASLKYKKPAKKEDIDEDLREKRVERLRRKRNQRIERT